MPHKFDLLLSQLWDELGRKAAAVEGGLPYRPRHRPLFHLASLGGGMCSCACVCGRGLEALGQLVCVPCQKEIERYGEQYFADEFGSESVIRPYIPAGAMIYDSSRDTGSERSDDGWSPALGYGSARIWPPPFHPSGDGKTIKTCMEKFQQVNRRMFEREPELPEPTVRLSKSQRGVLKASGRPFIVADEVQIDGIWWERLYFFDDHSLHIVNHSDLVHCGTPTAYREMNEKEQGRYSDTLPESIKKYIAAHPIAESL